MKGHKASTPGEASAMGTNTNKRQPGEWPCWSLFHSPPQSPLSLPAIQAQTLTSMSWARQLAGPSLLLSLYPCNLAPSQKCLFFHVSLGGTCTSRPSHPPSNPFLGTPAPFPCWHHPWALQPGGQGHALPRAILVHYGECGWGEPVCGGPG